MYHAEKIPSAIERYQKEIIRVLGVLESVLSKQEYLVGNKLTIADLSFITYVPTTSIPSVKVLGSDSVLADGTTLLSKG